MPWVSSGRQGWRNSLVHMWSDALRRGILTMCARSASCLPDVRPGPGGTGKNHLDGTLALALLPANVEYRFETLVSLSSRANLEHTANGPIPMELPLTQKDELIPMADHPLNHTSMLQKFLRTGTIAGNLDMRLLILEPESSSQTIARLKRMLNERLETRC